MSKTATTSLKELLVCLSHSWGGLEQVCAQDAIEHASRGLVVSLLCYEGSPIARKCQGVTGLSLISISFRPRNHFDFSLGRLLKSLVREQGIQMIHCHQPSILGSVVPWFWKNPNVAIYATRHIMNDHSKKDFYHRTLYGRLNALFVVSESLRQNVLETHAIESSKVKIIPLALDFNRFDPARVSAATLRKAWGVENAFVVGLAGRIDPAKGQETLIRAAAKFSRGKVKFVMIGELTRTESTQNDYLDHLTNLCSELGVSRDVVFAGFQEDVPQAMVACDLVVMPSRQEAFGLVAIEAMAMQRPVLISQGGSAHEIVGEGEERGRLVQPDDPHDLYQKVTEMMGQREAWQAAALRAREYVCKTFSPEQRVSKTLKAYLSDPIASKAVSDASYRIN